MTGRVSTLSVLSCISVLELAYAGYNGTGQPSETCRLSKGEVGEIHYPALPGAAAALVERHVGEVPRTLAELTALPGVGRKTANVILGNAYGLDEGFVVDTHVGRLARRLGLTSQNDPVKIEADLMPVVPRERWTLFAHWLIAHGRTRCVAKKPDCPSCELQLLCPTSFQHGTQNKKI